MTADDAWDDLNAAMEVDAPLCDGQVLFTTDGLTEADRAACASICARCPVADPCNAYANEAKVTSGFWAGHYYSAKTRK